MRLFGMVMFGLSTGVVWIHQLLYGISIVEAQVCRRLLEPEQPRLIIVCSVEILVSSSDC